MCTEGDRKRKLIREAVEGDATALETLLADNQARLSAYIAKKMPAFLAPSVELEDLLNQTRAEVFRRIRTFRPRGPDSYYRWVATIALNLLHNVIRRHRSAKRGGNWRRIDSLNKKITESTLAIWDVVASSDPTPSRVMSAGEAVEAVHAAIAELPDHYRQAIWQVHIEGHPVAKVAKDMGRSEPAVYGLCRRGMKLLHRRLGTASNFLSRGGGHS